MAGRMGPDMVDADEFSGGSLVFEFLRIGASKACLAAQDVFVDMRLIALLLVGCHQIDATLIVTAPFRAGIVICGDKRSNDAVRGDLDESIKITQIGKSAAFAATGRPDYLDRGSFKELWSVKTVVSDFYLHSQFSLDTLSKLTAVIDASFRSFVDRYRAAGFDPLVGLDGPIFQVIFFFANGANQLSICDFQYFYANPEKNNSCGYFSPVDPQWFGNVAVPNELKNGHDRRFDKFRTEPVLRYYLTEKHPIKTIDEDTALSFAKRLIVVTSENTGKIETSSNHVGTASVCASLGAYDGAFNWLPPR